VHRAAAAGKHVLPEKPLEITSERAAELVEVCRDAGVRLGVVLQHRFRPAGMRLRELLHACALGALVGCSTSKTRRRSRCTGRSTPCSPHRRAIGP
jgi:predicted dehydrogenase